MSHNSLAADLCRAARKARGKQADLTRKARELSLARLAAKLWELGFQVHMTGQLKEKHVEAWVADMQARGCSKRTIANNLAHVRTALEGIKRRPFADKMSNRALGIAGASRAGTKVPMLGRDFERYLDAVVAVDPGIAIALELQRELGLRAKESVQSIQSIRDWARALSNPATDGFVSIIHGTKGGKTRRSPPLERERALDIIRRALKVMADSRGKLVRKPDLVSAMSRYHYVVRQAGMVGEAAPHSLRYAYATEHLRRLKEAGISRAEGAATVSTWLGHGDGRGTWVELVYGRVGWSRSAP
jgi:integrase